MNFKKFTLLNNRLQELLKEQLIFIHAERPDWWLWWKQHNLKDNDFEIDDLKNKIEQNRLCILSTIEELYEVTGFKPSELYEQVNLIFGT